MNGVLTQHLHELVHSLGASLDVPVEVTDVQLNRIARSMPSSSADEHLAEAVSPRHLGLSARSVALISEPAYIGGSADLGTPLMLVIPVRSPGSAPSLLLWITCARGPLSPERIESVGRIAEATVCSLEAAGLLVSPEWADDHVGRAFASGDLDGLDSLLGQAIGGGRLLHDGTFVCLALSMPAALAPDASGSAAQRRLTAVMNRFAEDHLRDRCLIAFSGSVSFALLAPHPRDVQTTLPGRLATKTVDLIFRSRRNGADLPWLVAVSTIVADRASVAVWQARQSLDLAEGMGWKHQVVHWERTAHMRGLAAVPTDVLMCHFISPSLRRLLEDESAEDLVRTLRAFLTTAGNVKQVAADLYLHRATVYHRIRRVETRLGVDLFSGAGRLEVHAGLLAAEIVASRTTAGREPPGRPAPRPSPSPPASARAGSYGVPARPGGTPEGEPAGEDEHERLSDCGPGGSGGSGVPRADGHGEAAQADAGPVRVDRAVCQPVRPQSARDPQRRAVLHERGAVDAGRLRASDPRSIHRTT
ncbi:PucR family transcriptional regulator [Streptosporangium sp. NPDC001559]|uniref:PucR family transcriptional regulator n=1 Tax=Streptosporangium sp. NPDC001559 TaxID=3366187 RepID=UPI0036E4DF7C